MTGRIRGSRLCSGVGGVVRRYGRGVRVCVGLLLVWAVLAVGVAVAASDPAPRAAFAPTRLHPLPRQVLVQCQLATKLAVCPSRLPRATIGYRGLAPRLFAERYRPGRNGSAVMVGMSFSYGAPWEPASGSDWRSHLWRNRPCCFFHFELWRALEGTPPFPGRSTVATVGGHRGDLAVASGFGMACGQGNAGVWFCNHVRFRWQQAGTWFVATVHRYGTPREAETLLGRIIRTIGPT